MDSFFWQDGFQQWLEEQASEEIKEYFESQYLYQYDKTYLWNNPEDIEEDDDGHQQDR